MLYKSGHIQKKKKVKFRRNQPQNNIENLHVILFRKKGTHGVGVCGKQRSILLPHPIIDVSLLASIYAI